MYAHEEQKQQSGPGKPLKPVTPPHMAGLPALQRLAGNAAVTKAIEEQRHQHDAHCGHSQPVQRSTTAGAVVQRAPGDEQDELYAHPPGPSVRVRGPRSSRQKGRTPNQLTAAEWQQLPEAVRESANKERLEIHSDPQTLQETDQMLHHTLGGIRRLTPDIPPTAGRGHVLEALGKNDPQTAGYWQGQDARDRGIGREARTALDAYQSGPDTRQERRQQVENALGSAPPSQVDVLRQLLERYEGVAIGGTHHEAPVWQFLATNMADIKSAGVGTVYLESIRADSYQADVDKYLATGEMSPSLQEFVRRYDTRMGLTGRGMESLLQAARSHGMRVKGVDGRPARRPAMHADALYQRAATMNTYASQMVHRDRRRPSAASHGYLMELGAAHTGAHRGPTTDVSVYGTPFSQGEEFPGVDDLLDIPRVIQDKASGSFRSGPEDG